MRGCACGKRARLCFSVKGVFHVKRTFAILLSAALLLTLLPACNPQGAAQPTQPSDTASPEATVSAPAESGLSCTLALSGVLSTLDLSLSDGEMLCGDGDGEANDRERLAAYISGAYGLDEGEWEEAAVTRATGANATELAVLRFADEDAARHGEESLKDYLHSREGDFMGYAPEQAALVAGGVVSRQGTYVGLFICGDSAGAKFVFDELIQTGELPEPPEPTATPDLSKDVMALLDAVLFDYDGPELEWVNRSDPDKLKSVLEEEYGLAGYAWADAAIARGTGENVFEVAFIRMEDQSAVSREVIDIVVDYLNAKEEAYDGPQEQAKMLNNGAIFANRGYIIVLASNLNGLYQKRMIEAGVSTEIFLYIERHLEEKPVSSAQPAPNHPDREKFTPPGKEDMSIYDTSAIRTAWVSGDPSGLSKNDRAVYDAARGILGEILTDGMDDLEKEEAIYGFMVDQVNYDWRHQDVMAETPRTAYEPYGGLVDRAAVCLGYATSFQLLCDLAGLECITVVGAYHQGEEEHAWNLVRLKGNWYGVDATWDANGRELGSGDGYEWRYFNLTSDELALMRQWDYDNVPEATATDRGRG